jgi:hypothetical protein
MGDNRNAPSWGKTIVVESERPIDVEQHFLANAKLLHRNEITLKQFPCQIQEASSKPPITDGGFLQPILSPVLRPLDP